MTTANRKKILLNAFNMNCVGHINHGLWTHPRDRSAHYTDLDYWADLAKTLERGKFDGIFLADIVGVYDVFGGGPTPRCANRCRCPSTIRCCSCPRWRRSRGTSASA